MTGETEKDGVVETPDKAPYPTDLKAGPDGVVHLLEYEMKADAKAKGETKAAPQPEVHHLMEEKMLGAAPDNKDATKAPKSDDDEAEEPKPIGLNLRPDNKRRGR